MKKLVFSIFVYSQAVFGMTVIKLVKIQKSDSYRVEFKESVIRYTANKKYSKCLAYSLKNQKKVKVELDKKFAEVKKCIQ